MLVSRRYERANLIVTSNKPFGAWGEIFRDEITAAAMVDRSCTTPKSSASKPTPPASKTATSDASRRPKTRPTRRPTATTATNSSTLPSGPVARATETAGWRRLPSSTFVPLDQEHATTHQPEGVHFQPANKGCRFRPALTVSRALALLP